MTIKHQYLVQYQKESEHKAATETKRASDDLDHAEVKQVVVLECGIVTVGQAEIVSLPVQTEIVLEREPNNSYDRWAIRVKTQDGKYIGYLPSGKNQSVARLMDAGKRMRAFIVDSTKPDYRDALKVFSFNEKQHLPVRVFMDQPDKKGQQS